MAIVWLAANTLNYPHGGGHFWAYLNWALGLKANGCQLIWVECAKENSPTGLMLGRIPLLRKRLTDFGLPALAVCTRDGDPIAHDQESEQLIQRAGTADLLLDLSYSQSPAFVRSFRRSAMLDIDPGLTQQWIAAGQMILAQHDLYFTIGETVAAHDMRIPDCAISWQYTPPCIALEQWPVTSASPHAPYTTISHWYDKKEWVTFGGEWYDNSKRAGFAPYFALPRHTGASLELALSLGGDDAERSFIEQFGWSVKEAHTVASDPNSYRAYVQSSRGEFSCVKPSCVRLQNAWISDRTLCYLASGKPTIVEHTGPSRLLPDSKGILRFRSFAEAIDCLAEAEGNYDVHAREARGLAEDHFDARKVVRRVLELALSRSPQNNAMSGLLH